MASTNEAQLLKVKSTFEGGQLDDAFRMLLPFRPLKLPKSRELGVKILRSLAHRADRHLNNDNSDEAWTDLLNAESLAIDDPVIEKLRQKLTRLMIANARGCLREGDPKRCEEILARLRDRGGASSDLDLLVTTCLTWLESRDLANLGEFQNSLAMLQRVERRLPGDEQGVRREKESVQIKMQDFENLQGELYKAVSLKDDAKILELGNKLLAISPRHPETLRFRKFALAKVSAGSMDDNSEQVARGLQKREPALPWFHEPFYLWIDGVGGYLVITDDRVSIGYAGHQASASVPWMADIGRVHCVFQRGGERFTLEAQLPCKVNEVVVDQPMILKGDEEITLGNSCRVLFSLPLQGSLTALVRPLSFHRPTAPVDGVVLMGQTLSLGREAPAHILVPGLAKPVIIFRSRNGLSIRSESPLIVAGKKVTGPHPIPEEASVIAGSISFSIEPAASTYRP